MVASVSQAAADNSFRVDMRSPSAGNAQQEIAMMALDECGKILDCNRASECLFKYLRHEMVWRHVSMLLPQLEHLELMHDGRINPRLRFLCRTDCQYQAVTKSGDGFSSKLYFNCVDNTAGHGNLLLIVRPAETSAGTP